LEYWLNGIHCDYSIAEFTPVAETAQFSSSDAKSIQPNTDSRWRLVARVIGVVIMLIGGVIGFELITMAPPVPQMIVLALVMIGLGGIAAWKPEL
jgi:hypothetical protein